MKEDLEIPLGYYHTLSQRSLVSGFILLLFTALVVSIVACTQKADIKVTTTEFIIDDINKALNEAQEQNEKYDLLWKFYINEPTTGNEVLTDIRVLEQTRPIDSLAYSVVLKSFKRIHKHLLSAENKYPDAFYDYPIKSSLILSLIDKLENRSIGTLIVSQRLVAYYKAWLNNSEKIDSIWEVYIKSLDEFETAEKIYREELNKFMRLLKELKE